MNIKKRISKLLIISMIFGVMAQTQVFASEIPADTSTRTYSQVAGALGYEFTEEDINSLIPVFEVIEQLPDELLVNGTHEQINQFAKERGVSLKVYNDNIGETVNDLHLRVKRGDAFQCVLSIGQLLVTVGIPATKITKIKNYIAALGGVTEAAKLLVGATTISEKAQGILVALGGVLMTITGIDGIREHCFS